MKHLFNGTIILLIINLYNKLSSIFLLVKLLNIRYLFVFHVSFSSNWFKLVLAPILMGVIFYDSLHFVLKNYLSELEIFWCSFVCSRFLKILNSLKNFTFSINFNFLATLQFEVWLNKFGAFPKMSYQSLTQPLTYAFPCAKALTLRGYPPT